MAKGDIPNTNRGGQQLGYQPFAMNRTPANNMSYVPDVMRSMMPPQLPPQASQVAQQMAQPPATGIRGIFERFAQAPNAVHNGLSLGNLTGGMPGNPIAEMQKASPIQPSNPQSLIQDLIARMQQPMNMNTGQGQVASPQQLAQQQNVMQSMQQPQNGLMQALSRMQQPMTTSMNSMAPTEGVRNIQ